MLVSMTFMKERQRNPSIDNGAGSQKMSSGKRIQIDKRPRGGIKFFGL